MNSFAQRNARYWDELAASYQAETRISVDDFHYGPLLPGDRELGLLSGPLAGRRCLELGGGAGQNSLYLASLGADAVALDISREQTEHGKHLSRTLQRTVDHRCADMDALPQDLGRFHLIHSAYGLPFSSDPRRVVRHCMDLLHPGGQLLFSLGHPVYAGEWLELDDDERGIFLRDYFNPLPDLRNGEDDTECWAQTYPVSEILSWFLEAGAILHRVLEPPALPVHTLPPGERLRRVPYDSPAWGDQVHELQRFPIVLIVSAHKAAP